MLGLAIGDAVGTMLEFSVRDAKQPILAQAESSLGNEILRNYTKHQASRGGLTPPPTCHTSARWLSPNGGCGRSATKGVPMITRRNCLIGAPAALICAPAIVRAGNLMAIGGVPAQRTYYGFCDRLRIDCLYRSGKLRGGALIHAADEGLLRHIPQAKLDYDIGR